MENKHNTPSDDATQNPAIMILLLLLFLASSCRTPDYSSTTPVGESAPREYMTPIHQKLTPIGLQVELPGMRPQALALSPNGRLLATSGKTSERWC